MTVEPFRPYHLELMKAQGVQIAQVSHLPANAAKWERPPGAAVTAFDGERVILCGGIVPMTQKIGLAWAVLSADAGKHMLWLHRATKRFMESQGMRRIEATVEWGFPAGCRWAKLLGFKFEGRMRGFGDNGETHLRYGWTSWHS